MMDLTCVAKLVIIIGAIMIAIGVAFLFSDKIPWFGKLPGDIYIERKNFGLYFPVATCTVISIILSVILYFLIKR